MASAYRPVPATSTCCPRPSGYRPATATASSTDVSPEIRSRGSPSCWTCRVTSPSMAFTPPTTRTRSGSMRRSTRRAWSSSTSGGVRSNGASSAAARPAPRSAACQSISGVLGMAPTSTTVSTVSASASAMRAAVAWTVPASSRSTAMPRSSNATITSGSTCSGEPTTVTADASRRSSSASASSGRRRPSVRRSGRPLIAARCVPRIIVAGWPPGTRTTSSAVANAYCMVFTAVSNRFSPTMRVTVTISCFWATAGPAMVPSTAPTASRTRNTEPTGRITASERTRRP